MHVNATPDPRHTRCLTPAVERVVDWHRRKQAAAAVAFAASSGAATEPGASIAAVASLNDATPPAVPPDRSRPAPAPAAAA